MSPLLLLILACSSKDPSAGGHDTEGVHDTDPVVDADGDGFIEDDCDDSNGAINPAATDIVGDGIDQNCDGADGVDADGDGHAAIWSGGDDCDDGDPAAPLTGDDADCDGAPTDDDCDDDDPASTLVAEDADCDGTLTADDCDDGDPAAHPGAADGLIRDNDCDGAFDGGALAAARYAFAGESSGDQAGSTMAAGDIDGDGRGDLLLGSRDHYEDGLRGAVYLILGEDLGAAAALDSEDAALALLGHDSDDVPADDLAAAGDVDGDGLDDLLIGALASDRGGDTAGAAYLLPGASLVEHTLYLSEADYTFLGAAGDHAGEAVAGAGDVDGDGRADLLIGAPYASGDTEYAGVSHLVLAAGLGAPATRELADADAAFTGAQETLSGSTLIGAGDVDADGRPDLLINAPAADPEGAANGGLSYLLLSGR